MTFFCIDIFFVPVPNHWFLHLQIKDHKGKHLDDLMDTIRQNILIKWNNRKRCAQKFEGKILPHIVQKLRDDSYNLDIEVITSSPDGIAEICAKEREATAYRFVVNLTERTCTCRAWQGSGIPCKHAIVYIRNSWCPSRRLCGWVLLNWEIQSCIWRFYP